MGEKNKWAEAMNNFGKITSKRRRDGGFHFLGIRLCNGHKDEEHLKDLYFAPILWLRKFEVGIGPNKSSLLAIWNGY